MTAALFKGTDPLPGEPAILQHGARGWSKKMAQSTGTRAQAKDPLLGGARGGSKYRAQGKKTMGPEQQKLSMFRAP